MKEHLLLGITALMIGSLIGISAGLISCQSADEWSSRSAKAERALERERERELRLSTETVPEPEKEKPELLLATPDPEDPAAVYIEGIPEGIQDAARRYGEEYGISPAFLLAIAKKESRFDACAKSGSCVGLMQVSTKWHRDRMERLQVTEEELWTVDGNVHVAADYLAELFQTYQDPGAVLIAYNCGSAEEYVKGTSGLSAYAKAILRTAADLEEKEREK